MAAISQMIFSDAFSWMKIILFFEAEKNRGYFPDDIFKCISLNDNVWIRIIT